MDQKSLKAVILKFLQDNFVMSVAVCEDNKPTSSVLVYYVDKSLNFYFVTHAESYKAKKLLKNPHISLSIWKQNFMLVQADGDVSEITDPITRIDIIGKIADAAVKDPTFLPPLLKIEGESYIVFRVKPTWIRKFDLTHDTDKKTKKESPFAQLKV